MLRDGRSAGEPAVRRLVRVNERIKGNGSRIACRGRRRAIRRQGEFDHRWRKRFASSLLGVASAYALASSASALAQTYTVTDITPPVYKSDLFDAFGGTINAVGDTIMTTHFGYSDLETWFRSHDGTITQIVISGNNVEGTALNRQGTVTGWTVPFGCCGYVSPFLYYSGDGQVVVLSSSLFPNGTDSTGTGINDHGTIVGQWQIYPQSGGVIDGGFLYNPVTDRMKDLATVLHLPANTEPLPVAINNRGQIAGNLGDNSDAAWFWDSHHLIYIGALSNFAGPTTVAGLNLFGEVVGTSPTANGKDHAFIWSAATGMIDLGVPPGFAQSWGYAINNAGDVVGAADGIAIEVKHGKIIDLNTVVDPTDPLFGKVVFDSATSINALGEIVVHGPIIFRGPPSGKGEGPIFMLQPVKPRVASR
jgi:probable HAF family extracellular repeat protein